MTDLETLRPEVREDFESFDELMNDGYQRPMGFDKHWSALRAELLRLARNDADARIALDADHDWREMYERAKKAEAELAALKARIAEAPEVRMSGLRILTDSEEDARSAMAAWCAGTKRVRLVVEE